MENTFNPQQIICVKDAYDTEKEFWEAIGMQLEFLTKQGYYALFRHDDCDIDTYVIEFEHDPQSANEDWGRNRFVYLTADEEEEILNQRKVAASNE